jgi:7-cyano-7-deazaguanine synthase
MKKEYPSCVDTNKSSLKENEMSRNVLVLLSGGVDSAVLLCLLASEANELERVGSISFNYGQRHAYEELCAARRVWDSLQGHGSIDRGQRFDVDITGIGYYLKSALLGRKEIPGGEYSIDSLRQTVVPNRNMILLSIAAGVAQSHGYDCVAYAAHAGDHPIYADCRPIFARALDRAIELGTGGSVYLLTPFIEMNKQSVLLLGQALEVPFGLTYSCYVGGEKHCGACSTCIERRRAFVEAGIEDPTTYAAAPPLFTAPEKQKSRKEDDNEAADDL